MSYASLAPARAKRPRPWISPFGLPGGSGSAFPLTLAAGSVAAIPSFLFALLATDFLLLPIQEIT